MKCVAWSFVSNKHEGIESPLKRSMLCRIQHVMTTDSILFGVMARVVSKQRHLFVSTPKAFSTMRRALDSL